MAWVAFVGVRVWVAHGRSAPAAVVEKLDAGAPSIMTSGGPVIEQQAPPIAPAPAKKPRQDAAIDLVWRDLYGMTISPPTITWVEESELNCGTGKATDGKLVGGRRGGKNGNGYHGWIDFNVTDAWPACVYGTFNPDTYSIRLAWPRGTKRFSTTAFAHELAHARQYHNTAEVSHQGLDFAPRGRVDQADRALRKHGL